MDHGINLQMQEVKDLTVEQACEFHEKYVEFHTSSEKKVPEYMSTADNFVTKILDFFRSGQFLVDVVDIVIQVVADALGLNIFIYQDNNGYLEVLKVCGGALSKDLCLKFTHDNMHSIGNHYEPIVREVGNEKNPSAEVEIENEETCNEEPNEEELKYKPTIEDEQSIVHEGTIEDEAMIVCEETIKDEMPTIWHIPTPTLSGKNSEYEDEADGTEYGPLDLTMKPKKQGETQHIPLPTERRKMVCNPNEDLGLIYTKQENEEPEQGGRPIIDDTTVVTIKSGKPFPTWLYNNINAQYVQQIPDLINGFKLYVVNTTLEDYSDDTADLCYFDMKTSSKIKYAGIRKGGICQGSWECPNPHCTFKALSVNNQPNRVSWLNVKGYKYLKICNSCQCMAKRQGCGARKFVDFNPRTNIALVYHMGTHTCTP